MEQTPGLQLIEPKLSSQSFGNETLVLKKHSQGIDMREGLQEFRNLRLEIPLDI